MDIDDRDMQVRRAKLKKWIFNHFPSITAFAKHYGLSQGEISSLLRDKSFGPRRARSLERALDLPPRYLESDDPTPPSKLEQLWPFAHSTYADYQDLSPFARTELDIRIGEFIAGAKAEKAAKAAKKRSKRPSR
ncbi:Uncharacterised protein [Bordetella ansorpii]|uniref:Uncharacterized protein n=1 Tax=Bordetella ansorpii TaxID=288768 RepID=A0A157SS58_9BORD|nr:hypothetical protein [Bordetella ansorpii]SAI72973.1 Uncharacterised protein [Bordetella ansorpii]